jgi:putative ATPase
MIIFASEDIGNADPRALEVAVGADAAFARLGMPEGMFPMAQCCTYLASAPKSNASYVAWPARRKTCASTARCPVPLQLRNAPTAAHEGVRATARATATRTTRAATRRARRTCRTRFGTRYYEPKNAGFESKLKGRLERLRGEAPDPRLETKPEE